MVVYIGDDAKSARLALRQDEVLQQLDVLRSTTIHPSHAL